MPDPADPQSLNRFSYVRNNALKYTDPTGQREATECDEDPTSCWEEVDPNLVLEAWNSCIDCNKDLALFWQANFAYQHELNSPNPDPEVLDGMEWLMGYCFEEAQNHTNVSLWEQVAPSAGELGYILGAVLVSFVKDSSGLSMGEAPIQLSEEKDVSAFPFKDPKLASRVQRVLDVIEQGGPFPYPQDGRIFKNLEALLPNQAEGYYREYTVPTPGGYGCGTQRLVVGLGGEVYYTSDHYASFAQIR